jgi:methanogenic corrinoid protein MtbC1
MVGGAPVTQSFCDNIGADKYSPDAATAAEDAVELCK